MSDSGDVKSVSVFLDAENLIFGAKDRLIAFEVSAVLKRAKEIGRVVYVKAYGDFSEYIRSYVPIFQRSGVEMQQMTTSAHGKNTADMMLAMDALEMCLLPHAPDVFLIGSADRDFVPLVQKLKRYGATVIGLGIEGSISTELKDVCDQYLYYETLLQASLPAETSPVASAVSVPEPAQVETERTEIEAAIALLTESIRAVERKGYDPMISQIHQMMQSLDPGFSYERLGYERFIDFCKEAQAGGYVTIEPYKDTGHIVRVGKATTPMVAAPPSRSGLDYSSVEAAVSSYEELLRRKKVPLVPWMWRRKLVEHLWSELEQSGGMAIVEMNEAIAQETSRLGLWAQLGSAHVQKLTMTLNIAQCFERMNGSVGFEADMMNVRLRARYDLELALDEMNEVYITGVRLADPEAPLIPEALARLVFNEPTHGQIEWVKSVVGRLRGGSR